MRSLIDYGNMNIRKEDKKVKIERFLEKYKSNRNNCLMCPHVCGIDRNMSRGRCKEPYLPGVASFNLHYGEEPPISGENGSGTIFFSGCNMNCIFCQNFPISQLHQANKYYNIESFADLMLNLQSRKAHNINFVTPSHYIYQIVESLKIAVEKGLNIPIVYNSSGYDLPGIIRDLDGIIDIYLPDAKYVSENISYKYSGVKNYFDINRQCLLEIYSQTDGGLELDNNGIAKKGMIIRHLVLPDNIENSKSVLKWIRNNLSFKVHLSIMAQYFPAYKVGPSYCSEIYRKLNHDEYEEILDYAEELGFENAWFQYSG